MTQPAGERYPGGHPDATQIAGLADDAPAPAGEASGLAGVAAHVEGCAACQQVLADVLAVRAALAALPAVPLPPSVASRLAEALAEAHEPAQPAEVGRFVRARPRRGRPAAWAAAAAAAVAVLAGGGVVVRGLTDGLGDHRSGSTRAEKAPTAPGGGSVGSAGAGQGPAAATAAAAELPGLVRGLVAAHQQSPNPALGGSPPRLQEELDRDPAVAGCLAALGVPPGRLLLAVPRSFAGSPATILVLADRGDPTVVDVRVVRPGCPAGTSDLRYQLDRLPVG